MTLRRVITYVVFAALPAVTVLWTLAPYSSGAAVQRSPQPVEGDVVAVAELLLALGVVVVVARLAGVLAKRLAQPSVIGEILAGLVLGPSVFGALVPEVHAAVFAPAVVEALDVLAQIGVVFFMFTVGAMLHPTHLRKCGPRAAVLGHTGITVPFLCGVLLAIGPLAPLRPHEAPVLPFAMFCGIAVSVTAFPVLARILRAKGLENTQLGSLSLATAGVSDLTIWCLLTVVAATASGQSGSSVATLLSAAVFCAVMWWGVRPLLARLVTAGGGAVVVLLAVMLGAAATTDAIGVQSIFGAFVAGVVVPRNAPAVTRFVDEVLKPGIWWLLPVFFAAIGLRTDVGALSGLTWLVPLVVAVAVGAKLLGIVVPGMMVGMPAREATALGVLMSCRGLTEIIVLQVGLTAGLLPVELFTCFVIMALLTTAATAPALTLVLRAPRFPSQSKTPQTATAAAPGSG